MSVNRASKEVGLPWTSLIRYLKKKEDEHGGDHHERASAEADSTPSGHPFNCHDRGRFLAGNGFGTGGLSAETRQARKLLEEFSPRAARKLKTQSASAAMVSTDPIS
jgi:molybdenum-dependent DNA-binding transcriptional regulator ModE